MATLQQRYYDQLIERIRADRYPSSQLLDRVEGSLWTADQLVEYVDVLLDKIDESWYPSSQLLDRVNHMLARVAQMALAA
jgi:hypothetical protein